MKLEEVEVLQKKGENLSNWAEGRSLTQKGV